MGSSSNDHQDDSHRLAGPSEITYSQVCLRDDPDGVNPDLRDLSPDRRRKIERIRREIRSGTYESREKLEKAIDRLLEDIL
jgi:hypothetical protein